MGSDTAAMLEFCGKSRSLDLENDGEEIGNPLIKVNCNCLQDILEALYLSSSSFIVRGLRGLCNLTRTPEVAGSIIIIIIIIITSFI